MEKLGVLTLDKNVITSSIGEKNYTQGLVVEEKGQILDYSETVSEGMIYICAEVQSDTDEEPHCVDITLPLNSNSILARTCDCPTAAKTGDKCKHVAAVLIHRMKEEAQKADLEEPEEKKPVSVQPSTETIRHTDPSAVELLNTIAANQPLLAKEDTASVYLEVDILGDSETEHSLNVEFRLGTSERNLYILQDMSNFADDMRGHKMHRYGKQLEFLHVLSSFRPECRDLVSLITDFGANTNTFKPSIHSYYSTLYYEPEEGLKRNLSLKGTYLDMFFNVLKGVDVRVADTKTGFLTPYTIQEEPRSLQIHIQKTEDGVLLSGNAAPYYEGNDYIYSFDEINHIIYKQRKYADALPVIDLLLKSESEGAFFEEKDLRAFTKCVYPIVSAQARTETTGYDPNLYRQVKAQYSIYMDMLKNGHITCEIKAIYDEKDYNIIKDESDLSVRDRESESKLLAYAGQWFPFTSKEEGKLVLINSDDLTYRLIKEGIPALSNQAKVYVSDSLKRLKIKPMDHVKVSISASHDLLQLDFVTETLTQSQLAEILNRYDPQKKFYRLKNGTFIENDDTLKDLATLKDTLNLTSADITAGHAENIPLYRARYLEKLSKRAAYEIKQNKSFVSLIQRMNATEGKEYDPPKELRATLRPYQLEGFRWLCALKDNGFSGLLADEMGLGKTLQVISFLGTRRGKGRSLIVCPASLVYNWSNEINRFLPELHSRIISGNAEERKKLIESSGKNEVLITSYDLLKRDIESYSSMIFDCEVIDEAQYIKNARTLASKGVKAIRAAFRIALTGTPIENRLSELWSIFEYMLPGYFHSYNHFRERFEAPITRGEDDFTERELTEMIAPFVLRRLKKDVLQDLPEKLEEVYYAPLEGEQKELYDARVQSLKQDIQSKSDEQFKKEKVHFLAELTHLRQICCDPSLLYENYKSNSAKKEMCMDMLKNAVEAGHKVLLFSQFTTMLDEITDSLKEAEIPFYVLTGSTKKDERARMVEAFQKDDVPVFCISLKAGGTGLNLTAADVVIHYDPWWNTAVENQASDRAHRIGQKNVVTVYRLIMKDTIEERILKMQNEKSDLAGRILSGEGISSSKLSKDDLLSLL